MLLACALYIIAYTDKMLACHEYCIYALWLIQTSCWLVMNTAYLLVLNALMTSAMVAGVENDEEIQQLEEEIRVLQTSNSHMESQVMKLRNQISCMESKIKDHEKENQLIEERTSNLNEYLSYMKKSLIHCLKDIKLPNSEETLHEDNFDNYISQLRSLCLENYNSENKALYNAVKQALAGINVS